MTHGMAEIEIEIEIEMLKTEVERAEAKAHEFESEAIHNGEIMLSLAAEVAALKARVGQVANMVEIQSQDGNWNYSDYMCGLANGLLLAHATMTGGAYKPFSRPAQWIEEAKRTPPTEAPAP